MNEFKNIMNEMFHNRGMLIIIFGLLGVIALIPILYSLGLEFWAFGVGTLGTPIVLLISLIDDLIMHRED